MNTHATVPSFDLPNEADLQEWPDRESVTAGFLPGPISHTREHDGRLLWVFGGLLFDTAEGQIHAFSMKDATDLERSSVSQIQEQYRREFVYPTPGRPSKDKALAAKPWVRVEGRNNLYALAIARVCHFGGPDDGMSATSGDGREERGHLTTHLYDKGVLPASTAQDIEFRMSRVWSPEHGVQLEMQIQEHPADGPGHALPVLMSFHHQLGHEIARMIKDHPEQLKYWSGE